MEQAPAEAPELAPLLTPAQVSRRLQVSINTVHRLADSGQIASYRVGRLRRFTTAAVDAYLESCTHAPDSAPIRSVSA